MSQTKELISLLTATDHKNFVKFLKKRNKRHDTRNVDLFKSLTNNTDLSIKTSLGSNAFNALNKRLADTLLDFLAKELFNSEATKEIEIIKLILITRKLFSHSKYKYGFKLLSIAEKNAIELNDYTLLNEIYHTFIQYSHQPFSPNQIEVFEKFEVNQKDFLSQERINMVYAVIRKAFNEHELGSKIDLDKLINDTYTKIGLPKDQIQNFKVLFQLAEIADIEGAYKKEYHLTNLFFIDKLNEIKDGPLDNEKHLIYHIDLLYLVSNIYFRKKIFKESLIFLDRMEEQMKRFHNRYYAEREIKYTTLRALVLNYSGQQEKAINIISELLDSKTHDQDELSNPTLVKAMILCQKELFNDANKLLTKLQHSDKWYEQNTGIEWLLNKKYLEILLHIELGNTDYVDSRILSLTRTYDKHFKQSREFQVLPFLKLVKSFYHNPLQVTSEEFKTKVNQTIVWKASYVEDIFLMSFYGWLKSKMENKPLYQTTLELINQTK